MARQGLWRQGSGRMPRRTPTTIRACLRGGGRPGGCGCAHRPARHTPEPGRSPSRQGPPRGATRGRLGGRLGRPGPLGPPGSAAGRTSARSSRLHSVVPDWRPPPPARRCAHLPQPARGAARRGPPRHGDAALRGGRAPGHRRLPLDLQQLGRVERRAGRALRVARRHLDAQLHAGQRHGLRHAGLLGRQRGGPPARALRLPGRRRRCVPGPGRAGATFGPAIPHARETLNVILMHSPSRTWGIAWAKLLNTKVSK